VCLWLDDNGRVQPFLVAFGIGLNGVEGDVLVALGMPAIQISIEKGAVGFQYVVNPLLKRRSQNCHRCLRKAYCLCRPGCRSWKIPSATCCWLKVHLRFYQPPYQLPGGTVKRLADVDDRVRHDNALFSDGQSGVRTPSEKLLNPTNTFLPISASMILAPWAVTLLPSSLELMM
jgi:hypothetical protein